LSGLIDDNPLTSGATTLTSTELGSLPAVGSSEHVALVLDPTSTAVEIVYVTAHTGSATTATVVRGREGTTARAHASTVQWVHVATASDWTTVGDSNDEPSGTGLPYEGQTYIDTTNDEWQIYSGSAWITGLSYGAWTSYTPTLTNWGLGNGTVAGRYYRTGRLIVAQAKLTLGSTSTKSGNLSMSIPVASASTDSHIYAGHARLYDASAASPYPGVVETGSGASAATLWAITTFGSYSTQEQVNGSGIPFTWTTSDVVEFTLVYESGA
jgi:hypothetical protein